MNLELKPCPFCGRKAHLFVSEHGGIRVICPNCGATSKTLCDAMTVNGVCGNATRSVIEAWNKRDGGTMGIGSLLFFSNDLSDDITIKDYLKELLKTLVREQDEFSGKRPLGNGGWAYDLYRCLIENRHIGGTIDKDGCVEKVDEAAAIALLCEYIEQL